MSCRKTWTAGLIVLAVASSPRAKAQVPAAGAVPGGAPAAAPAALGGAVQAWVLLSRLFPWRLPRPGRSGDSSDYQARISMRVSQNYVVLSLVRWQTTCLLGQ